MWRNSEGVSSDAGFATFSAAIDDASVRGFDRDSVYWLATSEGRTTHFRPGQPPVYGPVTEPWP